MVYGQQIHPQIQEFLERANSNIKGMLVAWMNYNNTQDCTIDLKFVVQQDNKLDLTSSYLLYKMIKYEYDLRTLLHPISSTEPSTESVSDVASESSLSIIHYVKTSMNHILLPMNHIYRH
ncbi:unnamed protein product [Lepeophtheirus salmonis]|uniref:(salmon louse) hypothetical protein n=1 Tax=Lepeophtheirus salmonis TaxID=72036 RepID=A0A7R8D3D0_LEPSM|nr:unnamed protein product [Lepeophtheirus salmonis]CAF3012702.1 unnamed protein product [Lepeophtheirus salmonis]